jgi:hypothetical protein
MEHFALRLGTSDSSEITLLSDREGGSVYSDVVSVFEGGLHFAKKHLASPPNCEQFCCEQETLPFVPESVEHVEHRFIILFYSICYDLVS